MRILVVSDIHGRTHRLREALEQQPTARHVVFLGDGLRQVEDVLDEYPDRTFYTVPGNCDIGASGIPVGQESFGGKRFYFTHGHLHDVKYTLYRLELAAREMGADVALFGHTHVPYREYADGLHLFNPGSLGYGGTYGYVDIEGGGIFTAIVEL